MSDNDPFSERDDTERTVIRPNPSGRRKAAQPSQPAQPQTPDVAPAPSGPSGGLGYGVPSSATPQPAATSPTPGEEGAELALSFTGMNRLIACASPLFALVSRIRNRAQHADPDRLRQSVVAEVREFESRALHAGIDPKDVKVARYAICATIDDVVLNTPWGEASSWSLQSMVGTFHRETVGGDRFYDLLARLEKDPSNNIDMLEFLYMCLSLGFEGRLRVEQGGPERHLEIRRGLAGLIRAHRGPVERELSPHADGLNIPNKALSIWRPVWIALGTAALILTIAFLALNWALGGVSDRVMGQLSAVEPSVPPTLERRAPPPPPVVQPLPEKFEEFLKAEIDEGIVEIEANANFIVIRLAGAGMFASASNVLQDKFEQPVARVAAALNSEPGRVIVVGHSDNVPIRSSRWKSNMELSLARAESVLKLMSSTIEEPERLKAEGRAEKEPLVSNDTKEGRARNRRIEVLLMRSEG